MQIRRVLALCLTATLVASGSLVLAQGGGKDNKQQQQPKRSKTEQADVEALVKLVDGVSAGTQPAPTDIPLTWESNHFVKGQDGMTYVPFTVTVDRSKLASPNIALYLRVMNSGAAPAPPPTAATDPAKGGDKGGDKNQPPPRVTYPWDTIHFIEIPADGKLSRAIALKPGKYDAFVALKDKGTDQKNAPPAKMGLVKHEVTVPDFSVAELTTSSVILAKSVEPVQGTLSQAQQEANPYTFGPMKIVPSPDGKFAKGAELQVIFWIYGASAAASGKPDVQVEYNFHQRLPEGEKYFNKTAPQQLNAETLPPEFSVAAGHQLPGSLVVPLASFPVGDYRLEIKVTDKPSSKSVTQNVNFSVLAS